MVSEKVKTESTKPARRGRKVGVYAAVLLGVFLLGLVPMWLKASQNSSALAAAEKRLRLSRMQNDLASALINARRGDYEPARQDAGQFFTALREESYREDARIPVGVRRELMEPLLARRDEVITLLARNDPAAADKLSDLYLSYRSLTGG